MKRSNVAGFTLVELLVVLAILGLLAGLVGPRIINQFGSSKLKVAKLQIEELSQALDIYRLDVGRYPTAQEGLSALVQQPTGSVGWNGPYLKKKDLPKDPWGNSFMYVSPGKNAYYDIISYGADNSPGGDGENSDVTN